jgi:hypothetical protein
MVVVPSNEAVLFFLFHHLAGIVESLSENENGSFLQSEGTDGDNSHQPIAMTAISVGGLRLGTQSGFSVPKSNLTAYL